MNEIDARPVIWDEVGEMSAVHLDGSFAGAFEGEDRYIVIYNGNLMAQQGIVMRFASNPWGPYSDIIPLFDCWKEVEDLPASYSAMKRTNKDSGRRCYGGFTHPDLWSYSPLDSRITMRYNVSIPGIYKVLLVETKVDEGLFLSLLGIT